MGSSGATGQPLVQLFHIVEKAILYPEILLRFAFFHLPFALSTLPGCHQPMNSM